MTRRDFLNYTAVIGAAAMLLPSVKAKAVAPPLELTPVIGSPHFENVNETPIIKLDNPEQGKEWMIVSGIIRKPNGDPHPGVSLQLSRWESKAPWPFEYGVGKTDSQGFYSVISKLPRYDNLHLVPSEFIWTPAIENRVAPLQFSFSTPRRHSGMVLLALEGLNTFASEGVIRDNLITQLASREGNCYYCEFDMVLRG